MPAPRFPVATYRLQFNRHCTFARVARVMPYLADLGISDCYASPYLRARPGSLHGYDIVDPTAVNDEVGSAADYQAFVDALNAHRMGQILDVVPNHMHVAGPWNPWWQDVLEHGRNARYAHCFDIHWTPATRALRGKVLLPILGEPYTAALRNGALVLDFRDGGFFIRYHEHALPVDPGSYAMILTRRPDALRAARDTDAPHGRELREILTTLAALPDRRETDPERIAVRYRDNATVQRRLAALADGSPAIRDFLNDTLRAWNDAGSDPRGPAPMDALIEAQAYRPAFWREAGRDVNYRRFFDVNELAAIRVEDPDVFRRVHHAVFSLVSSSAVHGLRIDHVDGLYDPRRYLEQCREWARAALGEAADSTGRPLFIIVEKILGRGESLAGDWPVDGTTGYDFLHLINHLFVDARHEDAMDAVCARFTHTSASFDAVAERCKTLIMETVMAGEVRTLAHQARRLIARRRSSRDVTLARITHALKAIIACFPVYRTYVSPDAHAQIDERDAARLRAAVARAARRHPATGRRVLDAVRHLLLPTRGDGDAPSRASSRSFVMKFQQTTGPVTAKGIEDTALYRYHRLISLNEVGGDPAQFGLSVAAFHERMRERQREWPFSLSATSTHDTKRSEDVRARINVLSELPHAWAARVRRWRRLNAGRKVRVNGREVPSRNEEYFLYQTLLGAWPAAAPDSAACRDFCGRMQAYMRKAVREAKVHTDWITPDDAYERAVSDFIGHILAPEPSNAFLEDFLPFQRTIARYGMYNSLSQVTLKIGCPGVPDFYQGSEIWNLALVDPDNRRPVDFERLQRLAGTIPSNASDVTDALLRDLMAFHDDGRLKFYVTRALLRYRANRRELFQRGDYVPLATRGEKRHNLCVFQRTWGQQEAIVVVPRLIHGVIPDPSLPALGRGAWGNTGVALRNGLPAARYRQILTNRKVTAKAGPHGAVLAAADIFQHLPVAVMERL